MNVLYAMVVGAASVALTACDKPAPVLILPPADLAECADEPPAPILPERDGANQRARDVLMLEGYLRLREAYGSCRSKVDGLRAWLEAAG